MTAYKGVRKTRAKEVGPCELGSYCSEKAKGSEQENLNRLHLIIYIGGEQMRTSNREKE